MSNRTPSQIFADLRRQVGDDETFRQMVSDMVDGASADVEERFPQNRWRVNDEIRDQVIMAA